MAIPFVPVRAEILICDFDMARVHPEVPKVRRVVVLSPRSYNSRHGSGPGRCVVVPFSTTPPHRPSPAQVTIPGEIYRALSKPTWAVCDAVASVSHDRLTRPMVGGQSLEESLTKFDMLRIDTGLRHALGLIESK